MALLTLTDVTTLVAFPSVQTYIANRPGLFAELSLGGHKGERLTADQNGNKIGVVPVVPVVPSTPAP